MPTPVYLASEDWGVTTDATPKLMGVVEVVSPSVMFCKGQIICVRSDGAAKAWEFDFLVKKVGATLTLLETLPAGLNVFGSATDETALTGVAIAFFTDNTFIGVNVTGQAAQTINWSVKLTGNGLTP